jgi:hypothetical protein
MTSHDEGGWHDSLLADQMDHLERADRERLVVEYGDVLAELRRCPAASGAPMPDDDDPDPPVRWSPAARARPRCLDHAGHIEHRFRMLAQRALDAEDPLWRAWHAMAESRQLWEATRDLEASLPGSDTSAE